MPQVRDGRTCWKPNQGKNCTMCGPSVWSFQVWPPASRLEKMVGAGVWAVSSVSNELSPMPQEVPAMAK